MSHTQKTKEKIRKARLGKRHKKATIEKIRTAMLERSKLVQAGLLKPFRHSEATKKLMRLKAKKRKFSRHAQEVAKRVLAEKKARTVAQKARMKKRKSYSEWLESESG